MRIFKRASAAVLTAAVVMAAACPAYAEYIYDGRNWVWQEIDGGEVIQEDAVEEEYPPDVFDETDIEYDVARTVGEDTPDYEDDYDPDYEDNEFDDYGYYDTPDYDEFTLIETYGDSVRVGIRHDDISECRLYIYDSKKKKYTYSCGAAPKDTEDPLFDGSLTVGGLKGCTAYKLRLDSYGVSGAKLRTEYLSVKTLSSAPSVTVKKSGKNTVIKWVAEQEGAVGYEVYRKRHGETGSSGDTKYTAERLKSEGFELAARRSGSANGRITVRDGEDWEYSVRTFRVKDGKRIYSAVSEPLCTGA